MNLTDRETLELSELVNAAVDGRLTVDQRKRLQEWLRGSEAARRFYLRFMDLSAELSSVASQTLAECAGKREQGRPVSKVPFHAAWLAWLRQRHPGRAAAAFACMIALLATGIHFSGLLDQKNSARVVFAEGDVFLTTPSARSLVRAGQALAGGDTLETFGSKSAVGFRFSDNTFVMLYQNTRITMLPAGDPRGPRDGGKHLLLQKGSLTAQVAHQPADQPMTIGTLKAEAKVLGTTLDLAATTNETRLDVIKGEVELIRQEDGASIQTKSGYASVVDGGTELRLKRLLPAPWTSQDIGNSLVAGSAHCDEGVFTLRGSGDDIWNEADGFHYAFQPLEGDGEIEARVLTMQDTEWQAKAGLMIRESLSAESRNAAITVTPGHDIWFHYRPAGGGRSLSIQRGIDHAPDGKAIEAHAPYWLKLVRQAETFISYCSADGKDWQQVAAETIPMGRKVYVGLAVSSHNNPVLNTSSFDNVALKPVDESDNQPPAYEFNVDGDREGWTLHRLTEVNGGPRNGTWICNAATNYPWFMGPVMHLDATACARVKIRMADFGPSVTNSMLKIYWRRRDDAKFSESRNKATRIKNTGEWTDYTLDMSRHADWNGDIVQIRIDPIGAGDAHNVGLDYVRFEKQPK